MCLSIQTDICVSIEVYLLICVSRSLMDALFSFKVCARATSAKEDQGAEPEVSCRYLIKYIYSIYYKYYIYVCMYERPFLRI